MIKLYRGLLDIFIRQSEALTNDIKYHIRKFNSGDGEVSDLGAGGYWNFILESILTLLLRIITVFGIIFFMFLAIVFFPLHAFKTSIMNLINTRPEQFEEKKDSV